VKAPHHGSAGSSSPDFVDALRPAAVIFSAGRRNPFGHPAPAVVDRYRKAGSELFSTAEDGAIVMETDGHRVRVWTFAGRRTEIAPSLADTRHGGRSGTKSTTNTTSTK
jgi:competence protein ComEC